MVPKMTKEDLEWRARSDASTMAEYQAILQDPTRKKLAMAAAKKEADNLEKRMNVMKQAAGTKASPRAATKVSPSRKKK